MHLDSSFARVGTTCRSRPHGDSHSRRLARLQGVMVVWWTKHQLGPKSTRDTPDTRHKMPLDSSCARVGATCRSPPHGDPHSRRLARLHGVMVVWWTKHQLGPKTTRDSPNHTPQDACFLALAHTCHVQISTPWRYPLATSGTFARCHGSVVDQAPTCPEIYTR